MDICVIRALVPVRFIAKEEIALWPVVGPSARNAGTLFLGRQRLSSFRETLEAVRESTEQNISVAVFPEGTTSTGESLLPFKTGIFEVCTRTGKPILPVSIRYENTFRTPLTSVSYTGGESFAQSFWRTLGESRIHARVLIGQPIFPEGRPRKELAGEAWNRVHDGLAASSRFPPNIPP
jgi:1-acyl-sn-glycerol-3-phosphate acyltransferase